MRHIKIFLTVFLLLVPGNIASSQTPSSGKILPEKSELKASIERYSADERSLNRYFVFPFSSARLSRFEVFYEEWIGLLEDFDFDDLSQDGKIDYLLFKNHLVRALDQLQQDRSSSKKVSPLVPFAGIIIRLREDLQKMEWIGGPEAAKCLNDIKAQAMKARMSAESDESGIHKTTARSAAAAIALLREGLKEWFDFYNGYDPLFTWWAAETYKDTALALREYEQYVREELGGDRPGEQSYAIMEPAGREVLMKELAFEMIPYTPEEILAIGWQELAWCEKERLKATRELGYGDDWQKAIEHVKKECVEPGEQPELIRFMAFEAIDFLEKHDSLTIPPMVKELIRMDMMSIERQQTTPFFTGGEVISVAYPTNAVPYEQKISTMRGNNPHFSRAVVHHELVPGHNLQGFMAARHKRSYCQI